MKLFTLVLGIACCAGGCAKYEYELVQPADLARHIGRDWTDARLGPLEYRMRTVENRLVMHIRNTAPEPITLQGDRSYVVSPDAQSHPLYGQTIAPNTFIRLVLPPMRPYYESYGPTWGFGFGYSHAYYYRPWSYYYGYSYPYYYPYYYAPYWYESPRYYVLYDENNRTFWEWKGETNVTLKLSYQRGKETFSHEFVFHRTKM